MDANETNSVGSTAQTASTTSTTTSTSPSGDGDGYTTSTTVSSLADLKEKAPQVYEAMMQGIGMNMVNKMRRDQEHLKQIMREGNRVFDR